MDSFFARNRLSSYLDRRLPKTEAAEVAEAIARDTRLSADFDALRHTLDLLHNDGMCDAPTGFQARVLTAVESLPPAGSQVARMRTWFSRMPAEILAMVVALLVVGLALQHRSPTPSDAEKPAAPPAPVTVAPPTPIEPDVPAPETAPVPVAAEVTPPVAKAETIAPRPAPTQTRTPVPATLPYDPANPLGYRILHGGDQVLYDISALADETGGRLVTIEGKLFSPHSLSEARAFSQMFLVTSADNAASAHAKLLQRSGMEPSPIEGPKPPVGENEAVFLIEVQL